MKDVYCQICGYEIEGEEYMLNHITGMPEGETMVLYTHKDCSKELGRGITQQ